MSENFKKRLATSLFLVLLIFLILKSNEILILILLILGVLSLIEFFQIIKKIIKKRFKKLIINIIFSIYIFIFCLLFFFFSNLVQLKFLLFTILFGCIGSDIGGYIFGKIIKGPKLTKISPKKTISGAFGSIIFTCLIISSIFFFFTQLFTYKILILGIIISIACQIGDLFFSVL